MTKLEKKKLKALYRKLELFSKQFVRLRSGGKCECCGRPIFCEWAHCFSRAFIQLKFHPNNTFYLCKEYCHPYLDSHPEKKQEWVIKKIGADAHFNLVLLKNKIFKPNLEYFEAQEVELLKEIHKENVILL
jgi:hypothetical protein